MAISKVILNNDVQIDITDTTASQSDVASTKYYYGADGVKKQGSYVVPSAVTQATPTISVNSSTGLITASATQSAGVVSAGTKSATEQLSTEAGKTVTPTTSEQTAVAANKYTLGAIKVAAMPAGSAATPATSITANPSISVSSGGLITATTSATKSVTPTVSAGYVSSGTAGTITVSGSNTEQLSTQAAQTLYPSTTDQTISSGKFLTGTQTFKGVLLTNLIAANIASGVTVKVGDSVDDDRIASITGTLIGGLEYKTGTWTPTSNVYAKGDTCPTISLGTHTEMPAVIVLSNSGAVSQSTMTAWIYVDLYKLFGSGAIFGTTTRYGLFVYGFRPGSGSSSYGIRIFDYNSDNTTTTSETYPRYYVTPTAFKPAVGSSSSYYWRHTMTMKWVAAWAPTT